MTQDGHDPLLSSEETDALLEAMMAGSDEAAVQADAVDLTAPDRPIREAMAWADRCAEHFARSANRCFLSLLGCAATTEEEPCETTPWGVLVTSLQPGVALATVRTKDGSLGLALLGPALVSFVLDRRMGAPLIADDQGPPEPTQSLSNVDRRVLRPFFQQLVEAFGSHWCDDPSAFRVESVLARTTDLPAMPQFEPLLRVALRAVPVGAQGDEVLIALTAGAVLATAPRNNEAPVVTASDDDRHRMAQCVAATEVECVSVLGMARSSIRDVLGLSEGDVLRLDSVPGEAVDLQIGDVLVARGMPVVHHGNLALEITEKS